MVFIIRRCTGIRYYNCDEIPVVSIANSGLNGKIGCAAAEVHVGDSVHAKHSIQFCAIECADATLLNDGLAVIWRRKINELTSPSILVQRSKFLGSAK